MTDTQEYCCAAGVCCGDQKQLDALAEVLMVRASLSRADAEATATVIIRSFDLLPKAAGLSSVIKYVQAHPYRA